MDLFIANGTHQTIDFQYRLPEVKNYRQQMIAEGGQIRISGNLSIKDVEAVIQCHVHYGMIDYRELSSHRDEYIMYIYSVDQPVPLIAIQELIVRNRLLLEEKGRQIREEAAVTAHKVIQDGTPDRLKSLEFQIEEQPSKSNFGNPEVSENIVVTRLPERGASQDPSKPVSRRMTAF